jgi:ribonuclease P protein component
MLAQDRRLRKSRDIERVYKKGRFGGAKDLTLKALITHQPMTRATVVVAKKISKKAVVRNRIRRRLMEILAANWETLAPGCDIVVTVRSDVSDFSGSELTGQLLGALRRAGAVHK